MGVFRFKFTGPVFVPDKAGELGDRGLGIEAVYISNLSDDSGRVNLAYAGDGRQRVWDNLELLFNGLVQYLDLLLQSTYRCNRYTHGLVYGVVYRFGQPVGGPGRGLYYFGSSIWVGKPASACFGDESCQFFQVSVGKVIHSFKVLHERDGGSAGVWNVLVLGYTGAF